MRSRILVGSLFGLIGGLIGFFLQESHVGHGVDAVHGPTAHDSLMFGLLVGAMLGVAVGAVEGVVQGSSRLFLRGAALGGVIGAFGGMLGMQVGGAIFTALVTMTGKDFTDLATSSSLTDFIALTVARTFGWTFLGAFPGAAAGAATLSPRRARNGLIGGLIGGFLGGLVFDPLAMVVRPFIAIGIRDVQDGGGVSRFVGITVIGLATGFFVGLVEEMLKQAWVRVLVGRNEGKDIIISEKMTILGRDERATIPLFGDPNLAAQHAAIRMENGRHVLLDGGAALGTLVNGQRVDREVMLRDGDMLQLGEMRLLFREKATARRVSRAAPDQPKIPSNLPGAISNIPSHLCPFCGTPKDAMGNCQCTVPGAAAPGAPAAVPALPPAYAGAPAYAPPTAPSPMDMLGAGPAGPVKGSRLLGIEGPYMGQEFPLYSAPLTIGREPGNGIALPNDVTVSRHHAHLADEAGRHVVYDDGSSNGTFVNNVRISTQTLAPGDVVQFGVSKFRYD